MSRKNVFVVGLNEFNLSLLRRLRGAENYDFHGLLDPAEVYDTEVFPIADMLRRAEEQLRAFDGSIDAIAGYMDFPVSTMLPILCEKFGTRTVSLEALLKCEHKYWSRVCQREAIPEHIPQFRAFDPFDDAALGKIGLGFPFFVKPIKSSGSRLGFRIDKPEDFAEAIERFRAEINLIAEPFDYILEQADMPEDVRTINGHYCIAEEIIGGRQCTVEGYVYDGEVHCFGIVDSIRYSQVLSFFRYEYPSQLPEQVQRRIHDVSDRIMKHVGYDNSAFNIEYFWDETSNRLWLLEINTRVSQSHSDIFEKVDGVSNQQTTIDLALGQRPNMPHREGRFPIAAKFFHRVFHGDARVDRAPTKDEIEAIEQEFPGTRIFPQVEQGMRLSELVEQDSYSYALAYIYLGANDQQTLLANYYKVLERLHFEFSDIQAEHTHVIEPPPPQ
jgi:biotin carboxylase